MSDHDDLLPDSASAMMRAISQTSARTLDAPTGAIRVARIPEKAPENLLGHLAWERSVHHPSADAVIMRGRVDASFADHLSYGTPDALENELAQDIGRPVRVVECFQDRELKWPDFAIHVPIAPGEAPPDLDQARRAAIRRKNVRDWPATVRPEITLPPAAHFYAGALSLSVKSYILSEKPRNPQIYYGACARMIVTSRVL